MVTAQHTLTDLSWEALSRVDGASQRVVDKKGFLHWESEVTSPGVRTHQTQVGDAVVHQPDHRPPVCRGEPGPGRKESGNDQRQQSYSNRGSSNAQKSERCQKLRHFYFTRTKASVATPIIAVRYDQCTRE